MFNPNKFLHSKNINTKENTDCIPRSHTQRTPTSNNVRNSVTTSTIEARRVLHLFMYTNSLKRKKCSWKFIRCFGRVIVFIAFYFFVSAFAFYCLLRCLYTNTSTQMCTNQNAQKNFSSFILDFYVLIVHPCLPCSSILSITSLCSTMNGL